MSPLPRRDRLGEYVRKAGHAFTREVDARPTSARLPRSAPGRRARHTTRRHVVFLTPRSWSVHVHWEAMMARALEARGARVTMITCGGGLEICDRTNVTEGPPMPCRTCTSYVEHTLDAHGLSQVQLTSRASGTTWPELDTMGVADLAGRSGGRATGPARRHPDQVVPADR